MTAKTINKNALYFRQAAHHLGEREAERHLIIAMESYCACGESRGDDTAIEDIFVWEETPQGHKFWSIIHDTAIRDGIK